MSRIFRRRRRRATLLGLALIIGALMLFAAAASPSIGSAVDITRAETRVTADPANEYDPAVSGDIVVYTTDTGYLGTDVAYYDLATGVQTFVTSANGKQQLSDVSGRRIAYTDFAPPIVDGVRSGSDVVVYTIPDQPGEAPSSLNLTADSTAGAANPAIGLTREGHPLITWEDRRDGNLEIYARDLTSGDQRQISIDPGDDTNPAVAYGRIAWERRDGAQRDIELYDWETRATTPVRATSADESSPDIDGDTVVYQAVRDGEQHIYATDLPTGAETRLELPGMQRNPNISGTIVSFEDLSSAISHVGIWDLTSGAVWQLAEGTSAQFLNDIDGNRVVYTDDRDVQQDVYLTEFTLPAKGVAPQITSGASAGYTVGTAGSFRVSATGDPTSTLTLTGTLPAGLQFQDNGDGTATIAGTPALATGGIYRPTLTARNGVEPDAQQMLTLTVAYVYHGFFQPIDNNGVLNTTTAGRGIPVKFDLNGNQGLAVLAPGYPRSTQIACEAGQSQDVLEQTLTAAASSLTYDPTANAPLGHYVYVWKTDKAWAGQCRQLQLQFVDGNTQTANFRFTR